MGTVTLQSHLETDLRTAYERLTSDFVRIGRTPMVPHACRRMTSWCKNWSKGLLRGVAQASVRP